MMLDFILAIAILWIGFGLMLVCSTGSRGLIADTLFIVTWPIHVYRHFLGRE